MNIEAFDAESLRKLVRLLEYENRLLKEKLKKENIPYNDVNPFEETMDNLNSILQCFGEEKMFMPGVEETGDIFRNAKTDGMTGFARSGGRCISSFAKWHMQIYSV